MISVKTELCYRLKPIILYSLNIFFHLVQTHNMEHAHHLLKISLCNFHVKVYTFTCKKAACSIPVTGMHDREVFRTN